MEKYWPIIPPDFPPNDNIRTYRQKKNTNKINKNTMK